MSHEKADGSVRNSAPGAGKGLNAKRNLSDRGLMGAYAATLPVTIPVLRRHPGSRKGPGYLSECLKRSLILRARNKSVFCVQRVLVDL